jgi:hypothetical protein
VTNKQENGETPKKRAISPAELHHLYWAEEKSLSEISTNMHIGRSTTFYLFKRLGIPLRRRTEALQRPIKNISSPEFGYMLGTYHGDACISKTNQFSLTCKDLDFITHVQRCINHLTGIKPTIRPRKIHEKIYFNIKFRRKKLIELMLHQQLKGLTVSQRVEAVNALLDSEASVRRPQDRCHDIRFAVSDIKIIEFMTAELESRNIRFTITEREGARKGYKKMIHIRIGSHELKKFANNFHFNISRKQERLNHILALYELNQGGKKMTIEQKDADTHNKKAISMKDVNFEVDRKTD